MPWKLRLRLDTLCRAFQKRFQETQSSPEDEFEDPLDWSPAEYDTPTMHYERVPFDYELKAGEEVRELFWMGHSLGVWRVTHKTEEKSGISSVRERYTPRA